ncbi:REC8 meiotic recombination protein b isoform X4 [Salmo salar]|uniref:REC8 meiotic recombination protein b isoform X4 n=1 Tax=Salmo salar TaxID=8030 RepID=A0A1S3Q9A8_SALSA|nr:REC8 meiotic recombination protein b isoform X4 [Salmo salar]|eukprot:XP_014036536.1 PREDICTED: meiotic recombination protein REC8 homolog isoform X4 [Salmo salar]
MFYYPNVLQRHSGCFSTIWLAATKGIRITRRELLRVNVGRTCEDIMDYVTVQVAPLCPGLPRPRFSLYLSSQLQYGVVIVYHRQCGFLLEEIQQTIERLVRSERHARIDLAEPDRQAPNVPDSLFLLQEAEGAQDPFFGVMGFEHLLPSPYRIPQPWQLIESMTPERPIGASPGTAPEDGGFKSPPDAITLKEKEQLVIVAVGFEGADLPEATGKEIDMLLEQQDQFHDELEEREREREGERSRDMEPGMTSIDQLKVSVVVGDSVWLLDEETGLPMEVPLEVVPMEMTPPQVAMPSAPDTEREGESASQSERGTEKAAESSCGELPHIDAPPPKRRGRRRQLIFADPQVQISQDTMRVQIEDTKVETLLLSQVLINFPAQKKLLPAELYTAPSGSLLHPDLLLLWKQCAVLTTLPRTGERGREEETEEEGSSEMERVRIEVERKRTDSSMREIPQELLKSGGAAPSEASAEFLLDVSREDKSLEQITPVSRWSPMEEAPVPMEAIEEEHVALPGREEEIEGRECGVLVPPEVWESHLLLSVAPGGRPHYRSPHSLQTARAGVCWGPGCMSG